MAACKPDGPSCAPRETVKSCNLVDQQDLRQSIVVHIVINRIDRSRRCVYRAL